MAVNVVVERTGAGVRNALLEVSPAEASAFEDEYRAALERASQSLDVSEADRVLTHWWGIAHLRLQPLTEAEQETVRRFHAGEDVGWSSPAEYQAARGA